jgi:hypothetical protein
VLVERRIAGRTLRARCGRRNERRAASALSAFERLDDVAAGMQLRFGWSALRLQEDGDDALVACEPDFGAWPQQRWNDTIDVTLDVLAAQLRLLRSTGADGEDVAYDQVVLAAPGAIEQSRAFMRRTGALGAQDSGWLVGALDDPEALSAAGELEAVAVAALVRRRPSMLQPLLLPEGYVAVLAGEAVEQVLDGAGRERL